VARGFPGKEHCGPDLPLTQTKSGRLGQAADRSSLVSDAAKHTKTKLAKGSRQFAPLALRGREEQSAFRRGQGIRDQIGERHRVRIRAKHSVKAGRGGGSGSCSSNDECRTVMHGWRAGRHSVPTGQHRGRQVVGGTDGAGDDGREGSHNGEEAKRSQPGGGLGGARFGSCDQNALQRSALVREVPDVMCGKTNASISYFWTTDDRQPYAPARTSA
jgi:hypothetical protein